MLVRPVMKRLFYLGKPRRKRLVSLARLMITYPPAVPKIIQDERQSGEIPLGLATCTFPPWSTVAQMNTSFGVKSLPTNSAVSCKRFEKLVQKLLQVAGRGYWSKFETGKINAS